MNGSEAGRVHLLRLVGHGDDGRGEQAGEPDGEEEEVRRHERREGSPVEREARGLVPLLVLEHETDRVEAPVQEEDCPTPASNAQPSAGVQGGGAQSGSAQREARCSTVPEVSLEYGIGQ